MYFIYGMYHCLNIVTEPQGFPAAILIRAAEPLAGKLEINPKTGLPYQTNGPGKLSLALGLDLRQNGLDLVNGPMYVADRIAGDKVVPNARGFQSISSEKNLGRARIETSSRIGISVGQERKWRFFDENSDFVSGKKSK